MVPNNVHVLIPRTCAYVRLQLSLQMGLMLLNSWPYNRGIILGYPRGPNIITTVLKMWRASEEMWWWKQRWSNVLWKRLSPHCWLWGRTPWARQGGQLLQVGKDNEMNSPLEPPEGNVALLTAWIFVLWDPYPTVNLQNCKINLYCFKTLSLW